MRRSIRIAAGVVGILAGVGCALYLIQGLSARSALAGYKARLRQQGEKLKLSELASPPTTDPKFVAANAVLAGYAIAPRMESLEMMRYDAPAKVHLEWRGDSAVWASPNTNSSWVEFDRQMAAAEPALAQMRSALENPPPDGGWVWTDDQDRNLVNNVSHGLARDRVLSQTLRNAAIAALHHDDLDGARKNLHALAELARMNRNEVMFVSQMVRAAVAGVGLDATWQALQHRGWDEMRLAVLQHDWEGLDLIVAAERGVEGERANSQAFMAKVRRTKPNELQAMLGVRAVASPSSPSAPRSGPRSLVATIEAKLKPRLYKRFGMDADELYQLQHETVVVNAVRSLETNRPWPEVNRVLTNLYDLMDREIGPDRFDRYLVSALIIPNAARPARVAVVTETQRRLTIADIAIMRYQAGHGVAPKNLEALVPEFLAAVPIDPMSGKALRYRLNSDGSFVLYSVGEDGIDDGCDPSPRSAGDTPGLWEGKDAVWPTAAEPGW